MTRPATFARALAARRCNLRQCRVEAGRAAAVEVVLVLRQGGMITARFRLIEIQLPISVNASSILFCCLISIVYLYLNSNSLSPPNATWCVLVHPDPATSKCFRYLHHTSWTEDKGRLSEYPLAAAMSRVSAIHGQWCSRAHLSTSKCPFQAADPQVASFHGQWCARAHFNTSRCPPIAAFAQVRASHGQCCSRAHLSISR